MSEDLISIIDIASQTGKRKQSIHKIVKRLGIQPTKMRSTAGGGQLISYITNEDSRRVLAEIETPTSSGSQETLKDASVSDMQLGEEGVLYLLELEPEHDPGRFKVGFAVSLSERIRALRCSAPFARVVRAWPCKRLWEKTAIECVAEGCDRLHTEVFRARSLESVLARCEAFFGLMPKLGSRNSDT